MGDGSRPENGRAMSLESSTLSPSATCALGRSAQAPVFQTGKAGSTPAGHSRGRESKRPGRQPADHPCLNQGMLWVQLPPGPLTFVLVEQPGVLATLSRWRSWVRIPSGTLDGTVRKPEKRPSSNLGDRLWVQLPPVLIRGQESGTRSQESRLQGNG